MVTVCLYAILTASGRGTVTLASCLAGTGDAGAAAHAFQVTH